MIKISESSKHIGAETLTTEKMIPSGTNSSPDSESNKNIDIKFY